MFTIDMFTCFAIAGVGSLVGWGLMSLVHTEQPRVAYAVALYRWAFLCLAALGLVLFTPEGNRPELMKVAIGFAGMGVVLLGWAFRQLNGRRTPPWAGTMVTWTAGVLLWGFALTEDAHYQLALALIFVGISLAVAIDQGWLVLRSARIVYSEVSLLVAGCIFALHWLIYLEHVLTVPGPYPAHWIHSPTWLLPFSGIGFAILPLAVAAVVLAVINDRLNQQLRARALSDELTGSLSRRGLRELGGRLAALQRKLNRQLAIIMLDVDYFKAVNDRYGHAIGDEVLRHVTHVLNYHLREDALLARYGGEEFTVLLPVITIQEAHQVAERLRQAIEDTPCDTRNGSIRITVSVGLTFYDGQGPLEAALTLADERLFEAKQEGRNRVALGPVPGLMSNEEPPSKAS